MHHDPIKDLRYVMHMEKRLYFKRTWSARTIQHYFNGLLIEQDLNSPHRYVTQQFDVAKNDVVADIGAAEGIFAIGVIEKAKEVVLFEADTEWVEALEATFQPWSEKVTIINKFVSDKDIGNNISIDTYCKAEHKTFDFIKADVEGAELTLLNGCNQTLSAADKIKIVICAYHKAGDGERFTEILNAYGLTVKASNGFMIFFHDSALKDQYLRRGVLRAWK